MIFGTTSTPARSTASAIASWPSRCSQVRWGYIKVGVPQSVSSLRHIDADLTSSELELLS